MPVTLIIQLITEIGLPAAMKLMDVWAAKGDAVVTRDEWMALMPTIKKTYEEYMLETDS